MKTSFRKYWILVSIFVVGNIIIFSFVSKHLEKYVSDIIVSQVNAGTY